MGGAQAAFGMAQQRLADFSDPMVEPVRESIDNDIAALENLEIVDKSALTQELTSISGSIDTLAFKPLETLSSDSTETDGEQGEADSSAQSAETSGEASADPSAQP